MNKTPTPAPCLKCKGNCCSSDYEDTRLPHTVDASHFHVCGFCEDGTHVPMSWETVLEEVNGFNAVRTERTGVPGGFLYRVVLWDGGAITSIGGVAYVPAWRDL